jgi:drug/metabolite transporter (DMT)-like permease
MIWLALSIICSVLIFVVFKLIGNYKIDNLQTILVNYLVAFTVGQALNGFNANLLLVPQKPWFWSVLLLGFLFITLFQLMAWVSQTFGVASVSVAVKMSVIIPVGFGIWYFNESLTFLKIVGLALALAAVFLATYKPNRVKGDAKMLALPLLLFFGSGFLDAFINYNEAQLVPPEEHALFASSIFGVAGLFGVLFVLYRRFTNQRAFQWKAVLSGIALGIPNYGSIYFLLLALNTPQLPSSNLFALNNVGIVALSALLGTLAFAEKLSVLNKIGLGLALISMVLIFYTA